MTPIPIGSIIAWPNPTPGTTPEPSIDKIGLQIGSVAPVEIALAPTRPNVTDATSSDPLFYKVILRWGFNRDGVHAMTTTNISGIQPIYFQVPGGTVLPGKEIIMDYTTWVAPGGVLYS